MSGLVGLRVYELRHMDERTLNILEAAIQGFIDTWIPDILSAALQNSGMDPLFIGDLSANFAAIFTHDWIMYMESICHPVLYVVAF